MGSIGWNGNTQRPVRQVHDHRNVAAFHGQPRSKLIHVDAARNIVFDARTENRTPIAVVGLRDAIIVQTDDATMVAHKSQAQKIKEMVKKLAEKKEYKSLV